MPPFHPKTPGFWPSTVLFVLGLIDLVRGLFHTFLVNWAARTFAKLDLSVARQDQLTLLGAFGISNFLAGALFLLISTMAPSLSPYVLLAVPCAYVLGVVGLKTSGVKRESAFYGRYFMLAYLAVCLLTFVLSRFLP
jgi:hypothetical protein